MSKEEIYVGELSLSSGTVDVTDPCYDKNTWCGIFGQKVSPGKYACICTVDDFTHRILSAEIRHKDAKTFQTDIILNTVGVDAGLMSFSEDKCDIPDEEWERLCKNVFGEGYGMFELPNGKQCFFTESGYGDGMYPVHISVDSKNEVIGIKVDFEMYLY